MSTKERQTLINYLRCQLLLAAIIMPSKSNTINIPIINTKESHLGKSIDMDQSDEWDDDSTWPARLLHVRTLTSFPWQPGDIYGGYVKPRYNAISYTWGRFALRNQESPEVEAAPIKGTTWADYIPRMNPVRYTVQELVHAINTAACPHDGYPAVDFVWLDIACIDQTPNSPEMAREIGRQAKIFRGAVDSFVWLTTHTSAAIISWGHKLERLGLEWQKIISGTNMAAIELWLGDALAMLRCFLADDWFSSLWTLQEAFLSPKAIFMFKDGLTPALLELYLNDKEDLDLFRLETWIGTWQMFRGTCITPGFKDCKRAKELSDTITEVGFMDCVRDQFRTAFLDDIEYPVGYMGNPLGLLIASKHRMTTRETDRIYGIMQVFGLQLGKSELGATKKDFTLKELQVQLAEKVLLQYPIFSQLIIQNEDCTVPKAWMISPAMILSEAAYRAWSHQSCGGQIISTVTLSTETYFDDTWASFEGRAISLELLRETIGHRLDGNFRHCDIILDRRVSREMTTKLGHVSVTDKGKMDGLLKAFGAVQVLLLGFLTFPEGVERAFNRAFNRGELDLSYWGVGLLLQLYDSGTDGKSCYSRLGVVTWDLELFTDTSRGEMTSRALDLLKGNGTDWSNMAGLFG
ncbi:hypothetical protein F4782DRAFT_523547 [Xylaria castorea]|nr:hypothetical protein F4782DRAFT_523547 [Xylaria castorea]